MKMQNVEFQRGIETTFGNTKQCFLTGDLRFNLRERSNTEKPTIIYAVLRIDGKKNVFNTNVKVFPSHWSKRKQLAIVSNELTELDNRNNRIANDRLTHIREAYNTVLNVIRDNPNEISNLITIFADELNIKRMTKKTTKKTTLFTNELARLNDTDTEATFDTKRNRNRDIGKLETFFNQNGIANIPESVNQSWRNFKVFLTQYISPRKKRPLELSSANQTIRNLKGLFKQYNKEKSDIIIKIELLDTLDYKRGLEITEKQSKHIVFDGENGLAELTKIFNTQLENECMNVAKNLFVFDCLTSPRPSDLKRIIKMEDGDCKVEEIDGVETIILINKKTHHNVTIPLVNKLQIDCFNWLQSLNKELPFAFASRNTHLKNAFKTMGYDEVKAVTIQTADGEYLTQNVPLWQLVKFKDGRHTFVTDMGGKIPDEETIKVTGHTNTKTLEHYRQFNPKKSAESLINAMKVANGTPQPTAPTNDLLSGLQATPTQKITDIESAKLQIANERLFNENTEYRKQIFELQHEYNELKDELETERQTHTPNYDEGDMYVDYMLSLTEKG